MKKLLLLNVFVVVSTIQLLAQNITIGTGTAASYFYGPYYRSSATSTFNNSKYAYIYTPDELTTIPPGSLITAVEWQKAAGTITAPNTFQIFMENNSATVLNAGTTWGTLTASATSVYNNTSQGFTVPAPGWESFNLTSPFIYTGGTLQICTDHVKLGTASGANNYNYSAAPGKAIGQASNVAGSAATTLNTVTYGNNRPNIRISYVPGTSCSGVPTAGTAVSSSNAVCPSVNFGLSLNGATLASGLTYQWQSSTDGVNFTDITGATNSAFSNSQITNTYYQCIVTCTASASSDTSSLVFVSTNSFLNCYCTSNATSTADEEIFNVSLGTLNNSSTCSTTGGPGSVLSQYSDYTASVPAPILSASAGYSLSVQIGSCGGNFSNMIKVFIDYNQNGLFTDAGETVYQSAAAANGPHVETAIITIPANVTPGITRMRVVNVETTIIGNINPCGTYTWGETEDYLVQLVPPPTCPQPTALSLVIADTSSATLSWTPGGSETEWQIEYGPQGFVPGTGTFISTTTIPTSINGLAANSFYQAYVRAVCTVGDTSYWAGSISWNTYGQGQYIEWDNTCPSEGFIDISSIGTNLNTTDDSEAGVTLPFPFLYQGTLYSNITVGNNGGVILGTLAGQVGYTMVNGNALYPYAQDLNTPYGGVYQHAVGVAPNRKFVVQWDSVAHYFNGPDAANFELIIDEATQEIYFVYEDVQMSNPLWDYGADAEIGIRGTAQNINVSVNSPTYLQNNSCVHFYYTNCPKPTNFTIAYVSPDEVSFQWSAGLSGETNWTIIYGPDGFDPSTGGTSITTTATNAVIPGLMQLTQYDIYIFADCDTNLQSLSLTGTFLTPPYCANPLGMTNTNAVDSIFTAWTWTASSANYPSTSFNLQYGSGGFDLYSEGTIIPVDNNLTDSIISPSFLAGGVYDVYVQAVCGSDTSQFIGPFSIVMPLTNDSICGAELLPVNGVSFMFNNTGATVDVGDVALAPPATGAQATDGWQNSNVNNTTWFKFVAPPSGDIRIDGTATNYNGQIAVYDPASCLSIVPTDLVGANDNAIQGTSVAPNFTVCGLTPGLEYYLMHDGFISVAGNYSIAISEIILNAGTTTSLLNVCYGDTVNLFTGITGQDAGGVWTQEIPTLGLQDSLFVTNGLASVIFNFTYTVSDGCAADDENASIKIWSPSSAGVDGSITVCKNEPFNLLSGLNGNVDLGGTWYNPQNQVLSSSIDTAGAFPGQFNYDYIVSNGICPADTANVLIVVDPTCDYLVGIEELNSSVLVYPNPTSNVLFIQMNNYSFEAIEIFDNSGRQVLKKLVGGTNSTEIDVTSLVLGFYKIRIKATEGVYHTSFIKQ